MRYVRRDRIMRSGGRAGLVGFATVGVGLNYWVWTLVGPLGVEPATHFGLGPHGWLLLGALTAAVASLAAIPVGVAADRFRAPTVLAATTAVGAVATLALGTVVTVPVLVVVAAAAGVAGATLAVAAATVVRLVPPSWRAPALTFLGGGAALAAAIAVATRPYFAVNLHGGLLAMVVVLFVYAGLAAMLGRQGPPAHPAGTGAGVLAAVPAAVLATLRTPATGHLVRWYATAMCAFTAFDLYLPGYLRTGYGLSPTVAGGCAAACFAVAAAGQPVAGLLFRRRDPARLLVACFTAFGVLLLTAAVTPQPVALVVLLAVGIAVCAGLISGTVLAIIGQSAPTEHVGTATGVVSAGAGLVGLLVPLLLGMVHVPGAVYAVIATLAACLALASARRTYRSRSWITSLAAFPAPTMVVAAPGTTVVAVSAGQVDQHLAEVVPVLSALARTQELVIAYAGAGHGYPLVAALRAVLPRHRVVAVAMGARPHRDETAVIADLVGDGALPVALLEAVDPDPAAVTLARQLCADRVAHLSRYRLDTLAAAP